MSKRTFDDFDTFADDYRAIHTENVRISGADSFYFAAMKIALLCASEANISLRVLDLGCGDGTTEYFMQQHFPAWQIEGIDISAASIGIAKQKLIPTAHFQLYNGSDIPFANGHFDLVFVAGVFHHVDFSLHQKLANEIKRVLKTNGRLYLFEHNPNNPLTRYLVNTCAFDKDAKLLRNNYTRRLLKKAGLTIAFQKFIIFFPRKGWLSKLIFLEKYVAWLPLGGQYFIKALRRDH